MEVHHHPDLHHKNKKWKDYLLEFLMIFLAVTMGFIAENIREHISEHKNAHILAESLLEDLKKDTASLHTLLTYSNHKMKAIDSLLEILHSPRSSWDPKSLYTNLVPLFTALPFRSTDGTITQIKTSGTLRYFNQSLVNIINAYGVQLKKTEYRDEVEDKGTWILGNFNFDMVNSEVSTDIRLNKPVTHEMYINVNTKPLTDKMINLVSMIKAFRFRCMQEYSGQLSIGEKLIAALEKEYGLQDSH